MSNRRTFTVVLVASLMAFTVQAQPSTLRVTIDIKPGDSPTTVEPGRQGVIPVAILTTPQFDAASIDSTTIRIGPTGTEAGVFKANMDDVDRDKDVDMMILIRVSDMQVKCGDTTIRLTAKTKAGQSVEGSETVRTEGCH
jgi:hypothetical protein